MEEDESIGFEDRTNCRLDGEVSNEEMEKIKLIHNFWVLTNCVMRMSRGLALDIRANF